MISSGSPRPATRCRLGHFSPLRWLPPHDDHESAELQAARDVVKSAMNHDDLPALQAALQVSATAILQSALQISSDAKASLSEVLITQEGLTDQAAQVLATLLHEAAHSVAWQRGISDTSRQGRYHNHRFRTVAEELGLQVQRDSAFGWTQTDLRASHRWRIQRGARRTGAPRPPSGPPQPAAATPRYGIRTLACQCGHRLVRDGRSGFLAEATICSGCLTLGTSL